MKIFGVGVVRDTVIITKIALIVR